MTAPLRVGIVGAGVIGIIHARVARANPELVVVAVIDGASDARVALAAEITSWGDETPAQHGDLGSALAAESLDVVVICTPSGLHVELACEAIAAGCNVVIEKPLDVRLDRARTLLSALNEHGDTRPIVSVISQHRFDPASQTVKDLLAHRSLGRLSSGYASVSWWRSQGYYDSAGWRGTWAMDGGGALMNQGIHSVDLLVWFMGEPVSIHGTAGLIGHSNIEIEDIAAATLTFENGSIGVIHATTAAYPGLGTRIQLMGDEGSAIIDNDALSYVHVKGDGPPAGPMGIESGSNQLVDDVSSAGASPDRRDPTQAFEGHARQYENIVDAIRGRAPLQMTVRDAVRALAVVHAIYASVALGRSVAFDEVMAGDYDDVDFGLHQQGSADAATQ